MRKAKLELTNEERTAINVLNYIATFDGIITNEEDRHNILNYGIFKFIPTKKRELLSITETAYPMKIKIKQL